MGMIDGIISGAASLIGGAQANQKSWDIAQSTNEANAQEAQKNRDFQESQRKTQYQTAVTDLMAAGLNPMLAYSQGGAGTTSGAQATMQQATVKDVLSPAAHAYQTGSATAADVALKQEQATATTAQAEVARTQAIQNIAQTAKANQDEKTGAAVEEVNKKQLDAIAAEIEYKKAATRTTSAQTGKTLAETKNVISNEAPSGDPYWYRDLKKFGHSAKQAWETKIAPQYKYLKGN
jgi:HD-GYP domain-containing protein (c-di-GMP phosphodiesterase class II)